MENRMFQSIRQGAIAAAMMAVFPVISSGAINYIVNGDAESGFYSNGFQLRYTGSGTTARYNVDVVNKRFQTYVDNVLDLDIDLTDPQYAFQGDLRAFINAHPDYDTLNSAYVGQQGVDSFSPTSDYTDDNIAGNNIKNVYYPVQVRQLPSWDANTGENVGGLSSIYAHSGKYGINVFDNRPYGVLAGSPASVRAPQQVHVSNPNWTDLVGEEVILSGWALAVPDSPLNDPNVVGDRSFKVRVHHGVGGASVNDVTGLLNDDQWHYFQTQFTINPSSDGITVLLFAREVGEYAGIGHVVFDDLSLTLVPEPATLGLLAAAATLAMRRRR